MRSSIVAGALRARPRRPSSTAASSRPSSIDGTASSSMLARRSSHGGERNPATTPRASVAAFRAALGEADPGAGVDRDDEQREAAQRRQCGRGEERVDELQSGGRALAVELDPPALGGDRAQPTRGWNASLRRGRAVRPAWPAGSLPYSSALQRVSRYAVDAASSALRGNRLARSQHRLDLVEAGQPRSARSSSRAPRRGRPPAARASRTPRLSAPLAAASRLASHEQRRVPNRRPRAASARSAAGRPARVPGGGPARPRACGAGAPPWSRAGARRRPPRTAGARAAPRRPPRRRARSRARGARAPRRRPATPARREPGRGAARRPRRAPAPRSASADASRVRRSTSTRRRSKASSSSRQHQRPPVCVQRAGAPARRARARARRAGCPGSGR